MKVVKKFHETDTFKCVSLQGVKVEEILYGMSEIDFIAHAKVLPPRTKTEE